MNGKIFWWGVERAFLIFLPLNTAILFICYVRNFIPRQTKPEPIIKTKSEDFHPKKLTTR
ncbi:hypothetical protein COT49_01230 [candidate division WWE3 bacterium CG08_land_8_20_14_0_20_40_13]|uniref:Uncharacterized protein n=1 Tax=candidate division WWE3 bacterium CG08_land_8_20_14_0_20_40_13 TaxID=1975084 RepID=A0A2H0XE56_UNCKA|nr:MAG: hypothetical protein COT49_01230 [candidate division WWE3 bacterium CG08_land_8_20_14_0_20_40_13]